MAILTLKLKETYLKKAEVSINYQQNKGIKPGNNVRINLNITKGLSQVSEEFQEAELGMDLHAIESERVFFQMALTQVGVFSLSVESGSLSTKEYAELVESECSKALFPLLKETAIILSKKSGFNPQFFEQVKLEQFLSPEEPSAGKTLH